VKDLRIVTIAVEGSIDSGISKVDGSRATGRGNDLVRDIAVGTSNDYMEILAPLAIVLCVFSGDGTSPEDTPRVNTISIIPTCQSTFHLLDVGGAARVCTRSIVGCLKLA
jgi:hypothetical protein